jgi:hypothetical protein
MLPHQEEALPQNQTKTAKVKKRRQRYKKKRAGGAGKSDVSNQTTTEATASARAVRKLKTKIKTSRFFDDSLDWKGRRAVLKQENIHDFYDFRSFVVRFIALIFSLRLTIMNR